MSGFWLRVADLVVKYPITILTFCLAGLIPLAIIGAQTKANYSQLADLDPDQPSVDRGQRHPPLLCSRRAQSDGGPRREPTARLPVAGRARRHRRRSAADCVHPGRRRGPLAVAAARQAAGSRQPDKTFLQRLADQAMRPRPPIRVTSAPIPLNKADLQPHHPVRHRLPVRSLLRRRAWNRWRTCGRS